MRGFTSVGLVILILAAGWLIASKKLLVNQNPVIEEVEVPNPETPLVPLTVGKTNLMVELRKTEAEHALGLSYRQSLGNDRGMVFIYPETQKVLFWMKGMNFPLEFIWVARGIVVELTQNVSAPTSEEPVPKTIMPAQEVDMVVEVNAGWIEANGVGVGDVVKMTNDK